MSLEISTEIGISALYFHFLEFCSSSTGTDIKLSLRASVREKEQLLEWFSAAADTVKSFNSSVMNLSGEARVSLSVQGDDSDNSEIDVPATLSSLKSAFLYGCLASESGEHAVGRAFYAGYQLAISELFGVSVSADRRFSYCITESEGNHPRNIQATLESVADGVLLSGRKSFVTAPDIATDLFVVASEGWREGLNQLKVLHYQLPEASAVNKVDAGVALGIFPAMAFVPEIMHGSIAFHKAFVCQKGVLGGYEDYVRPFRWYEDLHVFSALFGFIATTATRCGDQSVALRMLTLASVIVDLSPSQSTDKASHLLFSGVQAFFRSMEGDIARMMHHISEVRGSAWDRDKRIFDVAEAVRNKRTSLAWQELQGFQ